MKILVIFTGGTIGSTESGGYIGPGEEPNYRLLSLLYRKIYPVGQDHSAEVNAALCRDAVPFSDKDSPAVELIATAPFHILSENSDGEFLNQLAASVQNALDGAEQQNIEGIIVTHGTDTLAYSAAMLGYIFADSPLPVVLVSSNYILEHPEANGPDNFAYAVEFISERPQGGVYVSYRNKGDRPVIHMGTRLLGHQAYSDAVYSLEKTDCNLPFAKVRLYAKFQREAPILQIHPSPGMRYPAIPDGTGAVLHHTYHAGTLCSNGVGTENFFAEVLKRGIPVFLTGAEPEMIYESMKVYEKYRIHVLPAASPISMYMKLWLLLVNELNPVEWMGKDIAGEFTGDLSLARTAKQPREI